MGPRGANTTTYYPQLDGSEQENLEPIGKALRWAATHRCCEGATFPFSVLFSTLALICLQNRLARTPPIVQVPASAVDVADTRREHALHILATRRSANRSPTWTIWQAEAGLEQPARFGVTVV